MKIFCYCFVDFKAQLSWCLKFEILWHLLVETQWITLAGGKYEPVRLAFIFLYLEIVFLCPVNDTGDGHFYFSWNVSWNLLESLLGSLSYLFSWVLWLPPAPAWCPYPSWRWHKSKLTWSEETKLVWSAWVDLWLCALYPQHFVELKCLWRLERPTASPQALLAGLGSSLWGWAHLGKRLCTFHGHHVGTKEQVGYMQKDIPALPLKC